MQVTVVAPAGNVDPEGGLHTATQARPSFPFFFLEPVPLHGQLSVTVGAGYVTTAEHWFGSVACVMLAGQVIAGGCVSLTVTVKVQDDELPDKSLTMQVTVVVPVGKNEPEAGEQDGVPTSLGQLSVAVAFGYVTTAPH